MTASIVAQAVALTLLASWALWVIYVAVMRLKMLRDAGRLTLGQKVFGYPTLLIGLALDAAVNLVGCSALFVELPREWTVSSRLWRHSNGTGWRRRVALAIRTELLDTADPSGVHRG